MKYLRRNALKNKMSGQSLFEVILALAVLVVIIVSIVSLTSKVLYTSTYSKNKAQANRYASEAMEFVRAQKEFMNWQVFKTTIGTGNWCLATLSLTNHNTCTTASTDFITGTVFQRMLTVSNVTATSMDLKVVVNWTDEKGNHETNTVSSISNW